MNFRFFGVAIPILTLVACMFDVSSVGGQESKQEKDMNSNSILLKKWVGPYGGLPPWRMVKVDEFPAAFDSAIPIVD